MKSILIKYCSQKKESFATKDLHKHFIGYNDADIIKPLCIKLPQMIGMLNALIVIRQCLSRPLIKNC